MGKRLIIILALVLVASFTCAAYAEVQNVKVSGDITAYGIIRNQFGFMKAGARTNSSVGGTGTDSANPKNEAALASVVRVRVDADLTDNVSATVRLLNERYWGGENNTITVGRSFGTGETNSNNTTINLDLAYVTLREFLYSPLTMTVGRQELHFGNDMIVGAVNTNMLTNATSGFYGGDEDLSARKSFDALRATLDYNPLVVDMLFAKITEDKINDNDDQNLMGVNAKYDFGRKNTTLEGYYWANYRGRKTNVGPFNGQSKADVVNVVGGLLKSMPIENLSASLEFAYQFGQLYDTTNLKKVSRKAFAAEAGLNYRMPKMKYTPSFTVLGAWFTGAKSPTYAGSSVGTSTMDHPYTGWDPMFENQKYGDIVNSLLPQSNVRLVGGMASMKPMDDITLQGEYYAYWWDRKFPNGLATLSSGSTRGYAYRMNNKRFAGQEIDLKATYDYTEDVQISLLGGVLLPGNSFDETNRAPASEVIGSMKVTF